MSPITLKERWTFESQQERDRFIDERFPERQMDEVPGGYLLPDGSYLGVIGGEVTHYEQEAA